MTPLKKPTEKKVKVCRSFAADRPVRLKASQFLTKWFSAAPQNPQQKRLKVETGSLQRRAAAAAKHLEAQKLAKVRLERYHRKLRESVLL